MAIVTCKECGHHRTTQPFGALQWIAGFCDERCRDTFTRKRTNVVALPERPLPAKAAPVVKRSLSSFATKVTRSHVP